MNKRLTPSDVFDTNPKTGALILGSNRLDDYASMIMLQSFLQNIARQP